MGVRGTWPNFLIWRLFRAVIGAERLAPPDRTVDADYEHWLDTIIRGGGRRKHSPLPLNLVERQKSASDEVDKFRFGDRAINYLASLVHPFLHPISGSVFYAGRNAFSKPSPIYILGLNPGGDPMVQARDTIATHMSFVRDQMPGAWSAYCDESWRGHKPGEAVPSYC